MQKPINRKTIFSNLTRTSQKFKKVSRQEFDKKRAKRVPNRRLPPKSRKKKLPKKLQVFRCPQFKGALKELVKQLTAHKFQLELFNVTQTLEQPARNGPE